MEKIKTNRAKCLLCGDSIESTHVHDFRACSCGNLHVDGGKQYLRRVVAGGFDTMQDLSEYEDNSEDHD